MTTVPLKPSTKTSEMDQFILAATGFDRVKAVTTNTCATCGKPVTEFRDSVSKKEYTISGMCQECQDSVFGG
jgi:hypothetical protein